MKTTPLLAILIIVMAACSPNRKQQNQPPSIPDSAIYNMHRGLIINSGVADSNSLVQVYVVPDLDIYSEGDTVWTDPGYLIKETGKTSRFPNRVIVGRFIKQVKRRIVIYGY